MTVCLKLEIKSAALAISFLHPKGQLGVLLMFEKKRNLLCILHNFAFGGFTALIR